MTIRVTEIYCNFSNLLIAIINSLNFYPGVNAFMDKLDKLES